MKTKKADAQILVIILLVLSILSIFVLAMVTNAKKDSQERRDNKKYEQFYSIGEQKLILAQNAVGLNQLTETGVRAYLLSSPNQAFKISTACTSDKSEAWQNTVIQCDLDPEAYEIGNSDQVSTTLYFSDDPVLEMFSLKPNTNMKIDLVEGATTYFGNIDLFWNNYQNVSWMITIDYFKQSASIEDSSYKSIKVFRTGASAPSPTTYQVGSTHFNYGIRFNIKDILTTGGVMIGNSLIPGVTIQTLRIKPLIADGTTQISIGLKPTDTTSFPAQFRRITAVVNSFAEINTGTDKSPTPVLNLQYPITVPINPLLDYVYRGGQWEQN